MSFRGVQESICKTRASVVTQQFIEAARYLAWEARTLARDLVILLSNLKHCATVLLALLAYEID